MNISYSAETKSVFMTRGITQERKKVVRSMINQACSL